MEQTAKPAPSRVAMTVLASLGLIVGALVLWLGTGAIGMGNANQPEGNAASNVAEPPAAQPKAEPAEPAVPAAEAPKGTIQPHGLEFKVPYDRGEGSLTFARQGSLLRVEALIRYPYYAGDGQRDRGSVLILALSVSGTAGRQLLFYPAPIWQGGPPTAYRVEARYSKEEGISQLNEEPSFGGQADVKYWDSWRATLLVDLRMVLVPGNSPASMADNWMAGIIAGNEVARMVFPAGMDLKNPAKSPTALLSFKFSELPAVDKPADELEKAIATEKEQQEAQRDLAAMIAQRQFAALQKKNADLVSKYPNQLWPKGLAYILAYVGAQNGLEGVDTEYLTPMKAYIDACPGQSSAHLDYLKALLSLGRVDDAQKHMAELVKSPLATGSDIAHANISLRYGAQLATQGFLSEASDVLAKWEGSELVAKNDTLKSLYNTVKDSLTPALAQWEAELKAREADAKKKNPTLTIDSTKGKIVIELFEDDAPNTVASLVSLAQAKFYDGLTFHRFVEGFVIQGGCPQGTGMGGPGYRLKSEVNKRNHFRGMVGMACTGPRTNTEGSQFYVCLSNNQGVKGLSGNYVIVGRVIEGMDAVDKLRVGDKMNTVTAGNLREHKYAPETIKE